MEKEFCVSFCFPESWTIQRYFENVSVLYPCNGNNGGGQCGLVTNCIPKISCWKMANNEIDSFLDDHWDWFSKDDGENVISNQALTLGHIEMLWRVKLTLSRVQICVWMIIASHNTFLFCFAYITILIPNKCVACLHYTFFLQGSFLMPSSICFKINPRIPFKYPLSLKDPSHSKVKRPFHVGQSNRSPTVSITHAVLFRQRVVDHTRRSPW